MREIHSATLEAYTPLKSLLALKAVAVPADGIGPSVVAKVGRCSRMQVYRIIQACA
jgi:hypothetical protein